MDHFYARPMRRGSEGYTALGPGFVGGAHSNEVEIEKSFRNLGLND